MILCLPYHFELLIRVGNGADCYFLKMFLYRNVRFFRLSLLFSCFCFPQMTHSLPAIKKFNPGMKTFPLYMYIFYRVIDHKNA